MALGFLVVFALCACRGTLEPSPVAPMHARDAAVATPADTETVAGDPPEPTPPAAECIFAPVTSCHHGEPTRTAVGPSPFEWCVAKVPGTADSLYPDDARFSAVETRKARAQVPGACCYIQFTTRTCR